MYACWHSHLFLKGGIYAYNTLKAVKLINVVYSMSHLLQLPEEDMPSLKRVAMIKADARRLRSQDNLRAQALLGTGKSC